MKKKQTTKRLINLKSAKVTLSVLIATYLAGCLYLWAVQDHSIFKPVGEAESTPERHGLRYERIKISSNPFDESFLDGFWIPSKNTEAPVVIYFHGQKSTIGKELTMTHAFHLHDSGCSVLVVDYRGYGRSFQEFQPTESSVFEDAEVAWQYVTSVRKIEGDRVFIFGHSLGGAIAIDLARRHSEAAGLIVEGTFTSVLDVVNWQRPFTNVFPVSQLLRHPFDSISKTKHIKIPILFIHGDDDQTIPSWMSEKLYESSTFDSKLLCIKGAGHTDCCIVGSEEYKEAIKKFVTGQGLD